MNIKKVSIIVLSAVLTLGLAGYVFQAKAKSVPKSVLSLNPSSGSFNSGDTFSVSIELDTKGQTGIVGSVYLNYDSTRLEVEDANSGQSGVQIDVSGTIFESVIKNEANATSGVIALEGFSLAGFGGNNLLLGVVNFKALPVAGGASVVFDMAKSGVIEDITSDQILAGAVDGNYIVNPSVVASLTLSPSSGNHIVGDVFNVDVLIDTGSQNTDGADIHYLNYDSSLLEVQDANGSVPGVQIQAGSLYSATDVNLVDNGVGRIDFSQTTNGGANFNGSGVLATIAFKVLGEGTAGLTFDFALGNTTDTNVAAGAMDILGGVTNGSYVLLLSTPNAPDGLALTPGDTTIDLNWSAPATGASPTGYNVYYGINPGVYGSPVDVGLVTSYQLISLTNGVAYYVAVSAYSGTGEGPKSLEKTATPINSDNISPAAISDLKIISAGLSSIALKWTAPGDNGNAGIANSYDLRYSNSSITNGNWDSATLVVGEPAPQSAGSTETMTVSGLTENSNYFFAIKTSDEVPNVSDLSNVAKKKTERPKKFKFKIRPELGRKFDSLSAKYIVYLTGSDVEEKVLVGITDVNGELESDVDDLTEFDDSDNAVSYDIKVIIPYHLHKKISGVDFNPALITNVQFSDILAGNLQDADNVINSLDWSIMNGKWGTNDAVADLTQDGLVNSIDWSLMNRNWGKTGD